MTVDQAYSILSVSKDTTLPAIRKAYRKLALLHHPDRNPDDVGARARFEQLVEAWHLIEDTTTGKKAAKLPPEPFCQNTRLDIVVPITVSSLDAANGVQIHMPLAACAADRVRVRTNVCRACGGAHGGGNFTGTPACACCRGVGHVPHTVWGFVDLPPGVLHGMRIRLPGRGLPGRLAIPPQPDGDLVLVLTVTGTATPQGPSTALVREISTAPNEEIVLVGSTADPDPNERPDVYTPYGRQLTRDRW